MSFYPSISSSDLIQAQPWDSSTPLDTSKAPLLFDFLGADAQRELDSNPEIQTMQTEHAGLFEGQTVLRATQADANGGTKLWIFNFTEKEIYFTQEGELIIDSTVVQRQMAQADDPRPKEWIPGRLQWTQDDCSIAIFNSTGYRPSYSMLDCNVGDNDCDRHYISPKPGIRLALTTLYKGPFSL